LTDFLTFFHWHTAENWKQKSGNKVTNADHPTTPQMRRYATLQNIKVCFKIIRFTKLRSELLKLCLDH